MGDRDNLVEAVVDATVDDLETLNMDIVSADDYPGDAVAWRVADDDAADWAVAKIAEERAELARIQALADEQIRRIKDKVQAAEKRCQNGTAYLTSKLAEYFRTVPHKKTKTTESYRLLSGTLKMKRGGVSLKQDDEKLLEYLRASGREDFIQTTEKARWGEFKKQLEIIGDQVVDKASGEIVEGVAVIENPDTFSIDV